MLAALLGSLIGLERELRAKEAGIRTHFLVTLGSALFMIISQYGFQLSSGIDGVRGADQARIAAQIVSGIGFIGAGTIMMQKQFVRGLTTAAGLWVAAAIGMAVGGGLYILASAATLLTLIGLELFGAIFRNIKPKIWNLVFVTPDHSNLINVTNAFNRDGIRIINYTVDSPASKTAAEQLVSVTMQLGSYANCDENHIIQILQQFEGVVIKQLK